MASGVPEILAVPCCGVRILALVPDVGRGVRHRPAGHAPDPDEPLGELAHQLGSLGVVPVDRQFVDDHGVDIGAGVQLRQRSIFRPSWLMM